MSLRFKNSQADVSPVDEGETVAALVKMLSGVGIDRMNIEAIISKTARPNLEARSSAKNESANDAAPKGTVRRSA